MAKRFVIRLEVLYSSLIVIVVYRKREEMQAVLQAMRKKAAA